MSDLLIKAFPRRERGKQNKKLRKKKLVPAVVYGNGMKSLAFSLDIRAAEKYSKKEYENKIFSFESEDKSLKGLKAIKKALSRHKASRRPLHLDFLSLDMQKPIRVQLDINFKGTAKGVKEEGGVFNIALRRIEIECLPGDIPPAAEIDISHLSLNQSLHVSDLRLSEKIKLITKGERALCAIVPAKEEEKKAETEGAGPPAEGAAGAKAEEKAETGKKADSSEGAKAGPKK